jgi:hypothetical protein
MRVLSYPSNVRAHEKRSIHDDLVSCGCGWQGFESEDEVRQRAEAGKVLRPLDSKETGGAGDCRDLPEMTLQPTHGPKIDGSIGVCSDRHYFPHSRKLLIARLIHIRGF